METKEAVRELLEELPLYTKRSVPMPNAPIDLWPPRIELECPTCGVSRPFEDRRVGGGGGRVVGGGGGLAWGSFTSDVYSNKYVCTGCRNYSSNFFIEVNAEEGTARKIGQNPPWLRKMSSELTSQLGSSADHFQRALTCLGQSYGLGACAYLRRVLEDVITPLLKLEVELLRSQGNSADADALETTLESKEFKTKTEAAYRYAPASLIVEGHNPFKMMHDHFSIGVHRLNESQCVQEATQLANALEFVVRELNRHKADKQQFADSIRKSTNPPPADV